MMLTLISLVALNVILMLPLIETSCDIEFTLHPVSYEVNIGNNISLVCELNDTFLHRDFLHYSPDGTVQVIGENTPYLNRRGFIRVLNGGIGNELMISNVRPFHAGVYACTATSDIPVLCKLNSMNATLSITGPPSLYSGSTELSGKSGGEVEISLFISGTSPLDYRLLKIETNGTSVQIIPGNSPRFSASLGSAFLKINVSDLHVQDGGIYRIEAVNELGNGNLDVNLTINGPDRPVVEVIEIAISHLNSRVEVTCSVQEEAKVSPVTYQWTDQSNRILTETPTIQIISDTFKNTLIFRSLTRNQTGIYACTANNTRGSNTGSVKIFGPPVPPMPSVINAAGRQRTIRWDRPTSSDPDEPILQYEIILYRFSLDSEKISTVLVNVTPIHDLISHQFTNLNTGSYGVTVASISISNGQYFEGQPSQSVPFTVAETLPVIAIAVGASAGVVVLVAIGAAIGIIFLCVCHPHKQRSQKQHQHWSRENILDSADGAVLKNFKQLTLRPSNELPPSRTTSPNSSLLLANIDPKWEFPRENITLCDVLCEGQFTVLYRGVATGIKEKPIDVAVKLVRDNAVEDEQKAFIAEMEKLSSIGHHPNILSMMRVCTVGEPMYMIVEYMCHGDLLGFLRSSRGHHGMYTVSPGLNYQPPDLSLFPRDLLTIGSKIANGMRYLADRKIAHGALCAKNVLVGSSVDIKINNVGSFDIAFESGDYLMKWMAPEILADETITTRSDVWSFGVTLWELVTVGGTPYGEIEPEDLYSQLQCGMRMPCPQHCAEEIYQLMLECWQQNPMDRPHFAIIHEKLEEFALSKMSGSLLDLQNYDGYVYSQFEEAIELSTAL